MTSSFVVFCILFCLVGCSAPKPQTISVFVSVSAQEALEKIGRDFDAATGTPVKCNLAASSTLARQVEQGADADLFLSADERWADYLADKGLVAERCDLLANRLVVVTPADRPLKLQNLADLAASEYLERRGAQRDSA